MSRAKSMSIAISVSCLAAALQGCRTAGPSHGGGPDPGATSPSSPSPSPAPVQESPATEWDLALSFLKALKARDQEALAKLLIDEKEFREILYPDMPYYDPSRPHVADFNWTFIRTNSMSGLQKVLARHGGLEAELLDVTSTGQVEERKGYKVIPAMDLKLRTQSGEELVLGVLGAMVDLGGSLKLMGFRT